MCVCARADDGLLGIWIFNAGAPGSATGPFKHLFANGRGYVLTGAKPTVAAAMLTGYHCNVCVPFML